MKRISSLLLLIVLVFASAGPASAQIFRGPDAARQAQKAANKNQKKANKAAARQEKALRKAAKKQQKALKKSLKRQSRV